jgi:L-asparaginase
MKKILVVGLGGTIGSIKSDSIGLDSNNLKIINYCNRNDVEFVGDSPFSILSENMSISYWQSLVEYLGKVNFGDYLGVIILHGSDTLAYTSSLVANAFPSENIVFVASDKPIEDKTSNGIKNFNNAVDFVCKGNKGVFVSYDKIMPADCITSANVVDEFVCIPSTIKPLNSQNVQSKNILVVNPYVSIDYNNYNLDNVDGVLIAMYHSATVPDNAKAFATKLKQQGIEYYFVTHKASADYETAQGIENIIFNCTVENAYARMLLG